MNWCDEMISWLISDRNSLIVVGGVWSLLFGLCVGSFLNVCIWRMPRRESIVRVPSHCPNCGHPIRWYENLPVVSYLALRGRCSGCGQKISPRYLIVELLTGLLALGIWLRCGFSGADFLTTLPQFAALSLMIPAAWIDAEHRIIPNRLTYFFIGFAIVGATVLPSAFGMPSPLRGLCHAVGIMLATGVILACFALLGKALFGGDALGWGDVKLLIAAGGLFGGTGVFFILLFASGFGVICAVGAVLFSAGKKRIRGYAIAFGPFIALGTFVWIFLGSKLAPLLPF
ncbi:MAG: prepilin peptidase [Victivallaceae bacterium]|nr:prepilin peptidase [Victivallaceae bacterium]